MGFLNNLFSGIGNMFKSAQPYAQAFMPSMGNLFGGGQQGGGGLGSSIMNLFGGAKSAMANPSQGMGGMGGGMPFMPMAGKSVNPIGLGTPPSTQGAGIGGSGIQNIMSLMGNSPQKSKMDLFNSPYQQGKPGAYNSQNPYQGQDYWNIGSGDPRFAADNSKHMLGGLFKGAMGLAGPMLLNALKPSPKMPDYSSSQGYQNLQNFNPRATQAVSPEVEASINRGLDTLEARELDQLRQTYKNARPGTDYTTDSAYQRDLAELQRSQGLRRSDSQANAQLESQKVQLQGNSMEQARLQELAQMDIQSIIDQTGLEYYEAEQFKDMMARGMSGLMG